MDFIRDIEDALLVTLNDSLSIPVIIDYSNGPEPRGDYGVLGLTVASKLHRNTVSSENTEDGLVERIKQDYLLRFTIKFYGDSCYSEALESQAILASRDIQEQLYDQAFLSYADITPIRRSPERRQTGYIQRALYDIKFLAGFEYTRTIDWFNTVSFDGEYVNADDSAVFTESETVSASDT